MAGIKEGSSIMRSSPKKQATRYLAQARRLVLHDQYNAAVAALDRAIACTPTAQLYDYRGVVLSLAGRVEEALQSFLQALKGSNPWGVRLQAEIYFHRGLLYGREGARDFARADFAQAVRLCRSDATYREALAEIERELVYP
jgi:tetratricopeptide (TPR) repeat protein